MVFKKAAAKIFLFLSFLAVFLLPQIALAGNYKVEFIDKNNNTQEETINYNGLVPCGKCVSTTPAVKPDNLDAMQGCASSNANTNSVYIPCTFCHFFIVFKGVIDFVLLYIVPPVAALVLIIGGIMFYFAGGDPNLLRRGKDLLVKAAIGLALIYGAYVIVGTVLSIAGVAKWTSLSDWNKPGNTGFIIKCSIEVQHPL